MWIMLFLSQKFIFIISLFLLCNGETTVKNTKVQRIVRKVFNITLQSLQNANSVEKGEIMKRIEQKLAKSAEPLGTKAEKYVKLIMNGLHVMANNLTDKLNQESVTLKPALRSNNNSEEPVPKVDAAQELADRILKLAEKYFEESGDDRQKIMENIKERILETAKKRHELIHAKHDKIKKYTDLITRGMELLIKKMTANSNKASKRRMIMEFVNSNALSSTRDKEETKNDQHGKGPGLLFYKSQVEHSNELDKKLSTKSSIINNAVLTTALSCDDVFHQTCSNIRSLNEFVCRDNTITLPFSKICNGMSDCSDGSDEADCINQAMERLQMATDLIARIEIYLVRNCFMSDNNALLLKQNTVLNDVLQRQINFLNKYKDASRNILEPSDAFAFRRTLNEVAVVINTLAVALDSSLCNRLLNKKRAEEEARRYNYLAADDLDEITEKPIHKISLKSCTCKGPFCVNMTCVEACKRVCWHKYNLGKWICQAVDEDTSVPLDLVCDGKLDCYDETDEIGCNTGSTHGKFEANEYFDSVLKLINTKKVTAEYSDVKNKLTSMGHSILKLQRKVMEPKIDEVLIKNTRDLLYASILSVYNEFVKKAHTIEDLEDVHLFLLNLNERLMTALKLSHTGNDRIISADGCYCRKSKCAAINCTPSCKRACAVGSKLTRYWCKGTVHNNISVPLDGICNGVPNCPFEDDETECSIDVCRKHHMMLLRRSIRDVGNKHKGTSFGEALLSWKTKVTSSLKIAESNSRHKLTPAALRELVAETLHDLIMVYATLEDNKRSKHANSKNVFNEFYDVSQRVIRILKSCTK